MVTFDELKQGVADKTIKAVKLNDGTDLRLFISTDGQLCRFRKRSSVRGRAVYASEIAMIEKIIYAPKSEELVRQEYNTVAKYRRMASTASFTNDFITKCMELPETYEQWVEQGKKTLYDYGVTTGNKIDGVVVTLDRIAKQYPMLGENIRTEIESKTGTFRTSRYPFAGYEMSLSSILSEDGKFMMHLNLEFKNGGNGYYYLLINNENFIGYDVD